MFENMVNGHNDKTLEAFKSFVSNIFGTIPIAEALFSKDVGLGSGCAKCK